MDEDLVQAEPYEMVGLMWATIGLCKLVGYDFEADEEDYINFFPVYNIKKNKFYVAYGGLKNGERFAKVLKLTKVEKAYVFNKFIEYYFGNEEVFKIKKKEWKRGVFNEV